MMQVRAVLMLLNISYASLLCLMHYDPDSYLMFVQSI